jgi:hypothetical protein
MLRISPRKNIIAQQTPETAWYSLKKTSQEENPTRPEFFVNNMPPSI